MTLEQNLGLIMLGKLLHFVAEGQFALDVWSKEHLLGM
jgi:hypothetical protein